MLMQKHTEINIDWCTQLSTRAPWSLSADILGGLVGNGFMNYSRSPSGLGKSGGQKNVPPENNKFTDRSKLSRMKYKTVINKTAEGLKLNLIA